MVGDISLKRLSGEAINSVYKLRYDHIDLAANQQAEPDFLENERLRDRLGIVLGFLAQGNIIGTIRLMPLRCNLTLTEQILGYHNIPVSPSLNKGWELGRLVLLPEYRKGESLVWCLRLTTCWVCENTTIEHGFGVCSYTLSRLYQRFGFTVLKKT